MAKRRLQGLYDKHKTEWRKSLHDRGEHNAQNDCESTTLNR